MNKKNLIVAGTIFIGISLYLKKKIDKKISNKMPLKEKLKKHIPTIITGGTGILMFGYLYYLNKVENNNVSEVSENISKYGNIINKTLLNNKFDTLANILKSIAVDKESDIPKNRPENLELFFECFTNTWFTSKKESIFNAIDVLNSDLKDGEASIDKFFNTLEIKNIPGFNKVVWANDSTESIGVFASKPDNKDYTILIFDEMPKIKL